MEAIVKTNFKFPGQKDEYVGKVRDVYNINDEYLVMLENSNTRSDGDRWSQMRTVQSRNGYSRLLGRKCMERIQIRKENPLRFTFAGRNG